MKDIKTYSSTQLCDIVITDRYLKAFKSEALAAMEELSARRLTGDSFDYESYIEEELSQLPNFHIDIKDLSLALENIKSMTKNYVK